jgi:uncharacterized protein (DUF1697 family)
MTAYAALLRGVNVGGRRRVPMPVLKEIVAGLGYDDVQTYVQSGNVVFTGRRQPTTTVATALEHGLAAELGFPVDVMVRTGAELADVIARNPVSSATKDPKLLHVGFLKSAPTKKAVSSLVAPAGEKGRFWIDRREIYLHLPEGIGRTKLNGPFFDKLGVPSTMRNWRTVTTLEEMTTG